MKVTAGTPCVPENGKTNRWRCTPRNIAPRGTYPLAFEDDGSAQIVVADAFGLGHLGNPVPVPTALIQ